MWLNTLNRFDAALADVNAPVPDGINGDDGRFNVYRNNVAVGLSNALAETFPVVKHLVGEEFFAAMGQIYVRENRPASPVLFEYGSTFPDFIETFEPAQSISYLADVARLERAWLDAYHSADARPLGIDVLASVSENHIEGLRFELHPGACLIRSDHPIVSIWNAHQITGAPDLSTLQWQGEQALIVRPELDVQIIRLDPTTFDFYTGLAAGGALGRVCDALGNETGFDPSAALAGLFNAGAVVALTESGGPSAC